MSTTILNAVLCASVYIQIPAGAKMESKKLVIYYVPFNANIHVPLTLQNWRQLKGPYLTTESNEDLCAFRKMIEPLPNDKEFVFHATDLRAVFSLDGFEWYVDQSGSVLRSDLHMFRVVPSTFGGFVESRKNIFEYLKESAQGSGE
jgi:hypothetical protein